MFFASRGNGQGTTAVGLESTAERKGAYQATYLILKPSKGMIRGSNEEWSRSRHVHQNLVVAIVSSCLCNK